MRLAWVIVSFGLVGCRQIFGLEPPGTGHDAAITIDTLVVFDASACVMASAECLNKDTLRTCAGAGADAFDTTCTWGCASQDGPHCAQLVPSGGGVAPGELGAGIGLVDTTLMGTLIINGDTGQIGTAANP